MKYAVAGISLVFACLGVAIMVGLVMRIIFPKQGPAYAGIGGDRRNLPRPILAVMAGAQSWRVSLRKAVGKQAKKR